VLSSAVAASGARAGIGIVLERAETGMVYIKRIAPDGPAAREGTLAVGDALLQVRDLSPQRLSTPAPPSSPRPPHATPYRINA